MKWYGTEDNEENGDSIPVGNYKFKIIAKNTSTEEIEDTAEGAIEIVTTADRPDQPDNSGTTDDDATMVVTNATSGQTSQTGPGILIYFLFPLGAYIISKRKK